MLQQDGNPIRKGFRKQFEEEFNSIDPKSTRVTFKLVKSIYDGKTRKPRSYSIPSEVVVFEGGGDSSEYIYYKTKQEKVVGGVMQKIYNPSIVTFGSRGDLTLDVEHESDLFIFLMKHSRRASGKNGDGNKKPLFYLEDKTVEAKERVAKEAAKVKMQKYLYDDENRLKDDELRTIAQALRVPNIDSDTDIALVQTSIEDKVKKNPQLFLSMKEVGGEVQMRANLQMAAESGILSFDNRRFKWVLNDQDSGAKADLAVVRKNEDSMTRLVYWLKNTDENDHYGKIMELLTGAPVKRKTSDEGTSGADIDKQLELARLTSENLKKEEENLTRAEALNSKDLEVPVVNTAGEKSIIHPEIQEMELETIQETLAKEHGVKYSHLTTKKKLIENLENKVPVENRNWTNKGVEA